MGLFDSNTNKRIPDSLGNCCTTDETSEEITIWSDYILTWGRRLLVFLIIIGAILTIIATSNASDAHNDYKDIFDDTIWITAISSMFRPLPYLYF